ncbi:MAG: FAD:protein FMN transferase [Christensenellales bacterium]|jgi:thiamine biosynthesis lipoprotein
MKKRLLPLLMAFVLIMGLLTGCAPKPHHKKYRSEFMDTFDTNVIVMAYTSSQAEFDALFDIIHDEFVRMHRLFDIYHSYSGINNIKTINDNAGIQPVKVDTDIIELIELSKEWHKKTDGVANIALGSVLSIWHEYREAGISDPSSAQLPPMADLKAASAHTDIDKVIVDKAASTVYLADPDMSLDVGAVAKGYATEVVARLLMEKGYGSVLISAGGNIRAIGAPLDGVRKKWGVGIKDPNSPLAGSTDESNLLDVAFVTDMSVVSSGVYERFYTVDGKQYHHLIDPDTLMPSTHYKAITVVTQDSGIADLLSTALFLMPPDMAQEFAESLDGVEALWILTDDAVVTTGGMKAMLRDMGGATAQ